jgi:hypothetical protein
MTVALPQSSPGAHVPLGRGVLRTRTVAARIETCCPPPPAPLLSWGRGVEAWLGARLAGQHALSKGGARLEAGGLFPLRQPGRARAMLIGWATSSRPWVRRLASAWVGRARSRPWRCTPSRPPGSRTRRPRSRCMGRMRPPCAPRPRASPRQRAPAPRGPPMGPARMGLLLASKGCCAAGGVVRGSHSAWGGALARRVTAPSPQGPVQRVWREDAPGDAAVGQTAPPPGNVPVG